MPIQNNLKCLKNKIEWIDDQMYKMEYGCFINI